MSLEHFDEAEIYKKPSASVLSDFDAEVALIDECLENCIETVSTSADKINGCLRNMQNILRLEREKNERLKSQEEELEKRVNFMEKVVWAREN